MRLLSSGQVPPRSFQALCLLWSQSLPLSPGFLLRTPGPAPPLLLRGLSQRVLPRKAPFQQAPFQKALFQKVFFRQLLCRQLLCQKVPGPMALLQRERAYVPLPCQDRRFSRSRPGPRRYQMVCHPPGRQGCPRRSLPGPSLCRYPLRQARSRSRLSRDLPLRKKVRLPPLRRTRCRSLRPKDPPPRRTARPSPLRRRACPDPRSRSLRPGDPPLWRRVWPSSRLRDCCRSLLKRTPSGRCPGLSGLPGPLPGRLPDWRKPPGPSGL